MQIWGNGLVAVNAAAEFVKTAGGIEAAKAALKTVEHIEQGMGGNETGNG